jgi:sulfur carrier protein ThiS
MKVTILPAREEKEVEPADAGVVLKRLGLHRDAYLVIRNDEVVTSDARLGEQDHIEIWPVISGGSRR